MPPDQGEKSLYSNKETFMEELIIDEFMDIIEKLSTEKTEAHRLIIIQISLIFRLEHCLDKLLKEVIASSDLPPQSIALPLTEQDRLALRKYRKALVKIMNEHIDNPTECWRLMTPVIEESLKVLEKTQQ